jgi:hypothetical protein
MALSTPLSQLLIAFTIELDNEFEHRFQQRLSRELGSIRVPFRTSFAMWSNFLRYVAEQGTSIGSLVSRSATTLEGLTPYLSGMTRWGYVSVIGAGDSSARRRMETVVKPTRVGRLAGAEWQSLPLVIERRWEARFGASTVWSLRRALQDMVQTVGPGLPDFLPVVRHGMFSEIKMLDDSRAVAGEAADTALITLLAQTLLAFAIKFEKESDLSLALYANFVRVLRDDQLRVASLPTRTGVARPTVAVGLGFLHRHGYVSIAGARGEKAVRLTDKGKRAASHSRRRLESMEAAWQRKLGAEAVSKLRSAMRSILSAEEDGRPLLGAGLIPPPAGWRAARPYLRQINAFVKNPEASLPHYPTITHRGGWPDGN